MKYKMKIGYLNNIIASIISVIAIFIALNANRIAKKSNEIALKQVSENLKIIDFYSRGFFSSQKEDYFATQQKLRLANLGGAPASIVEIKAIISYKNILIPIELRDYGNAYQGYNKVQGIKAIFIEVLNTCPGHGLFSTERKRNDFITLPFKIEAYDTVDLDMETWMICTGKDIFEFGKNSDDSLKENYSPIKVEYILKTSSGSEIITPKIECWYIKRNI
ncbi:hypothetical protein JW979_12815 [bacterium]|nr:hypothetical protein [candidate division CSSED10-310 bacterium]